MIRQYIAIPLASLILLVGATILTATCGPSSTPAPPPPVTDRKPVILLLFGAGFCGECKAEFPKVNAYVATLSSAARAELVFNLELTAGDPPSVKPDQAMADAYGARYAPLAMAWPDVGWALFKNVMPEGTKLAVPAAVAVDGRNGSILRVWKAGAFSVPELTSFLRGKIGD